MPTADLIFRNVNVLTMEPSQPQASLVAVRGERIVYVGEEGEFHSLVGRGTRVIDCQGGTLLPGFHDAHCHLLGLAARRMAVDCAPPSVRSIRELQAALAERAQRTPQGGWVRGAGYHEFDLAERRHPTRLDLDQAVPHHPAGVAHRSGHAHVLNTAGLRAARISRNTADPVDGVIERDERGEPTGLLLEMGALLDRVVPAPSEGELEAALREVNRELLSAGVTSVQEATEANDVERWETLCRLKREGALTPHLRMMPGLRHLAGFRERGLRFGDVTDGVRLGHAKGVLTLTTGSLQPPLEELREMVAQAERWGFAVALHAVEQEAVVAAAAVLGGGRERRLRHRVEHAAECPPSTLAALQEAGVGVVTQPAFIYASGDRYLAEVAEEMRPWLYRVGSFGRELAWVAASSDAPVGPLEPLAGVYAAVTRRTQGGQRVAPGEGMSMEEALALWTRNAAFAGCEEDDKGTITPGRLADLVLLDGDPMRVAAEELPGLRVQLTVVGGRQGTTLHP